MREANDRVSNATAKLPVFPHYNIDDVTHSSSDGQKFETQIHTIRSRHSPKYFEEGKLKHVFASLSTKVTSQGVIIGKLSSYARRNRTKKALWELRQGGPGHEGGDMLDSVQFVEEETASYATASDFCETFIRDMSSLYLLAFLLTGNDDKAARCFISALDAVIEVDPLLEGLVVLNAKMA